MENLWSNLFLYRSLKLFWKITVPLSMFRELFHFHFSFLIDGSLRAPTAGRERSVESARWENYENWTFVGIEKGTQVINFLLYLKGEPLTITRLALALSSAHEKLSQKKRLSSHSRRSIRLFMSHDEYPPVNEEKINLQER